MASQLHLELDRSLSNLGFESWRLSGKPPPQRTDTPLPCPVFSPTTFSTDYVHARNSALHNALLTQPGSNYVFLAGADGPQLHRVNLEDPCQQPLTFLHGLSPATEQLPAFADAPPLMPTVAEASLSSSETTLLFVSSGRGDLQLLFITNRPPPEPEKAAAAAPAANFVLPSKVVHPLRPRAPLQGVRPFQLLAASQLSPTKFLVVFWAVVAPQKEASADCPADSNTSNATRCEVFAATLLLTDDGAPTAAGATGLSVANSKSLEVAAVQLLERSSLPPFGALCSAATGGVVLAIDAEGGGVGGEHSGQQWQQLQRLSISSGGGGGIGNGAAAAEGRAVDSFGDAEEDDVSPRTLAAAAARLAHLTSDQLEDAEGQQEEEACADVFKESGPDGVGALGSEPSCSLLSFLPTEATEKEESDEESRSGAASSDAARAPPMKCTQRLLCEPHRLLGCQIISSASEHGGTGGSAGLRLSLTDDVDAAVLEILPSSDCSRLAAGFAVTHAASVPALAYVAAGKLQRKFCLAAGGAAAGGPLAAALVEARQYCYLYGRVPPGERYGEQQVLDMQSGGLRHSGGGSSSSSSSGGGEGVLGGGEGVLGAALLQAAGTKDEGLGQGNQVLAVLIANFLLLFSPAH